MLSRPHPPQASQVLLQPFDAAALCQEQVYRASARRLLCLLKTRPRTIGALGSNASAPAPPLSSSRRIFPCLIAAWVDEFAQDLDERHVRSSNSSSPPRNAHAVVRRRLVDRLLLLQGSFKDTTNRGHAPRHGHSPRATQGLLRYSDPDPARPFGLHHLLHCQWSPTGPREEVLCATSLSARAAVRDNQESSSRRLRPPSAFLRSIHLLLASSSAGSLSSTRSLQRARAVQAKVFPVSSSCRQPALLAQLFHQEPREPARALARSTIYCPLH